jgi:hypothetical protein
MYTYNVTTNIITRNSDGKIVSPVQNAQDPDYLSYLQWIEAGNTPTEVATPPPADKRITRLAFRSRLGQEAKIKIEMASLDNPSATQQQRQFAAALRVYSDDLANATHVDLARSDTITGINTLVSVGIITAAHGNKILTDPIQEHEAYYGG